MQTEIRKHGGHDNHRWFSELFSKLIQEVMIHKSFGEIEVFINVEENNYYAPLIIESASFQQMAIVEKIQS
jgi:hypothetical protein